MARLAFIYNPSDNWMGGINYYLSLFRQLNNEIDIDNDSVYIFTNESVDITALNSFQNLNVVRTRLLNSSGMVRQLYRATNKILGENTLIINLLKNYKIDVLSHAYIPGWSGIKCLPWIPDFQHSLLPEYFSNAEIEYRNLTFQKYLSGDNFLVSSNSALKDAESFFKVKGKAQIYRFLPNPIKEFDNEGYIDLCHKHNIKKPFLFMPNQFWKHKNHLLCFKACLKAKESGNSFTLICSGVSSDYRHPEYQHELNSFIEESGLSKHIKRVGLVDRGVFNCLLKESEILINPSRFEGWSTTVEEGKALGKTMALSNLNVHKEQTHNRENVGYFDVNNVDQCLDIIQMLTTKAKRANGNDNVINDEVDSIYRILKSIVAK